MTRGRDANCWDMCAFPNLFEGAERLRVTCGGAGGNAAGQAAPVGGKICRSGHLLPGFADRSGCGKARFYWVFRHGTALAEIRARAVGRTVRRCWSSAMFLLLGAASSAIDALKALTSSKSSSRNPPASARRQSPFDYRPRVRRRSVGPGSGSGGGGSQISPETMSALLDAQSQSSAGSTTAASKSRSNALKDLFGRSTATATARSPNRNSKTRSAPAAPIWRRPTTCSVSSTRTATARSASMRCRRR